MSFLEYHMIQEARRNPEMNPKVPAIKIIQQVYDEADVLDRNNSDQVHNCFASFTQLDKLGINPKSHYDTPNGIYAYDLSVFEMKEIASDVPFAGRSPYINLFKAKNPKKIVILNQMSRQQYHSLVDKIRDYYVNYKMQYRLKYNDKAGSQKTFNSLTPQDKEYYWKQFADEFEQVLNDAPDKSYQNSIGGQFWYITMIIAKFLANPVNPDQPRDGDNFGATQGASNAWNKLFRSIGVDGCVDIGEGIIHSAEKQQSYFVGADVVEMITRIDNKEYEKKAIPRDNRLKISAYMATASKSNNPKKVVDIVQSVANSDDKYANDATIGRMYGTALNVICDKMSEDLMMADLGWDNDSTKPAIDAVKQIGVLFDSIDYLNPKLLMKDGVQDMSAEFAAKIEAKTNNVMSMYPLLTIIKEFNKETARYTLARIPSFVMSQKPIDELVEILHFFHDVGWYWWEDSYYESVVNDWDKKFPNTHNQVGVWAKAENWGWVK